MHPQLADAFDSGQLIRPAPREPNLVHLVRALATLSGVQGLHNHAATRLLIDLIGPSDHYVFVLLDGLGMNIVDRLPRGSFLRTRLKRPIQAVFPSTTAAALTSTVTCQWPSQHAITGWFTHLPEYALTAIVLPFIERYTHEPLTRRGLTAQHVLPIPAVYPQMTHKPLSLMPSVILNTIYATYSRGYTPAAGYASIADAVDQLIAHITPAKHPTHVHLYIPDIDSLCHRRGVGHSSVVDLTMQIDAQLARLADALEGRARIVVSADHGLIDIEQGNHIPIFDGDPLLELLEAPPSGDARLPIFHVRPGRRQTFIDLFEQRFSHHMLLLETEQAEELNLLGPEALSPVARRRFGDFLAIAHRPATLLHHPPQPAAASTREPYLAQHAGLSPEEMYVPLAIA